jgi:hypothetical protein
MLGNDPVLAAVELPRAMDRDGTRVLPKRPPSSFLSPQWRKLIFANGAADHPDLEGDQVGSGPRATVTSVVPKSSPINSRGAWRAWAKA